MRRNKNTFRHESLQDKKSTQEILKSITRGLTRSTLSFSDEEDEIVLKPEGLLNLKITASQDGAKNRLSIRITWEGEEKISKKKLSVK